MHAERLAVISDVHGNAPALRAVLAEIEQSEVELVVSLGDVTWGPQPEETRLLLEALDRSAIFVNGNGERALRELRAGRDGNEREHWLRDQHSEATHAFLGAFVDSAVVTVTGLGPVRFCHGSPRSDIELITPETPVERMRALLEGVSERVLVSGHTHLQFDRRVADIRSVNPGSVGMPYQRLSGAFWALFGPDVTLMRTEYDLDEAASAYAASGDPLSREMIETLRAPPTPADVIEHAEGLAFSE
jgi:putative phosphoesterase